MYAVTEHGTCGQARGCFILPTHSATRDSKRRYECRGWQQWIRNGEYWTYF